MHARLTHDMCCLDVKTYEALHACEGQARASKRNLMASSLSNLSRAALHSASFKHSCTAAYPRLHLCTLALPALCWQQSQQSFCHAQDVTHHRLPGAGLLVRAVAVGGQIVWAAGFPLLQKLPPRPQGQTTLLTLSSVLGFFFCK